MAKIVLSKQSNHIPTYQECLKCPYSHLCHSGDKCIATAKEEDKKEVK